MTISTTTSRISYNGNGGHDRFLVPVSVLGQRGSRGRGRCQRRRRDRQDHDRLHAHGCRGRCGGSVTMLVAPASRHPAHDLWNTRHRAGDRLHLRRPVSGRDPRAGTGPLDHDRTGDRPDLADSLDQGSSWATSEPEHHIPGVCRSPGQVHRVRCDVTGATELSSSLNSQSGICGRCGLRCRVTPDAVTFVAGAGAVSRACAVQTRGLPAGRGLRCCW